MTRLTPQEAAEKWARKASAASQDYQRGIERVRESPTAKAVQKKDKLVQGFQDAVNSGKWETNTARVTLQEWQRAASQKGVPNFATGIQASQAKTQGAYQRLFPLIDQAQNAIQNMPDTTLEQRLARSTAFARAMSEGARNSR